MKCKIKSHHNFFSLYYYFFVILTLSFTSKIHKPWIFLIKWFPSLCCLKQRMHGFLAHLICLCNSSFHCLFSLMYCPSQRHMLSTLFMVLKGWYLNVNIVHNDEDWFAFILSTNFVRNPISYMIKFNLMKFSISCILPLTDHYFYWSWTCMRGTSLKWCWCLNKCCVIALQFFYKV